MLNAHRKVGLNLLRHPSLFLTCNDLKSCTDAPVDVIE